MSKFSVKKTKIPDELVVCTIWPLTISFFSEDAYRSSIGYEDIRTFLGELTTTHIHKATFEKKFWIHYKTVEAVRTKYPASEF